MLSFVHVLFFLVCTSTLYFPYPGAKASSYESCYPPCGYCPYNCSSDYYNYDGRGCYSGEMLNYVADTCKDMISDYYQTCGPVFGEGDGERCKMVIFTEHSLYPNVSDASIGIRSLYCAQLAQQCFPMDYYNCVIVTETSVHATDILTCTFSHIAGKEKCS